MEQGCGLEINIKWICIFVFLGTFKISFGLDFYLVIKTALVNLNSSSNFYVGASINYVIFFLFFSSLPFPLSTPLDPQKNTVCYNFIVQLFI